MEKRLVLALVLSLAVLFLYQTFITRWITPHPPQSASGGEKKASTNMVAQGQSDLSKQKPETVSSMKKEERPSAPQYAEEAVSVDTPLYKAVFSSKGGAIKSWVLKRYKESLEKTSGDVEMAAPVVGEYPLQDNLTKGASTEPVYFKPSKTNISLNQGQTEELVFTRQSQDGIQIEKKYIISANSYSIRTETLITNTAAVPFEGQLSTGLSASVKFLEKNAGSYHKGPIIYSDGKILTKDIKEGEETLSGKIGWLGLEDMYFLSVIIPKNIENAKWSTVMTKDAAKVTAAVPLKLTPNTNMRISYSAYLGPKEMDILTAQGVHLEDSISLGWFAFLARPLLVAMNFLYAYIPNYGLVIILLTVIIKILFHPLTKKGLDSMKEMQRIQPQVVALRERYKDDKEKMNRELMELYKRYKINPLGGCLPMILQVPVFIALYNVLGASIELRHAPLALWIHDLSAKDPYYVTPILMGATMLIQQKMTPSTMDPTQAKMMLIMPVVFTFMFLNLPSGLVLYWLVNNVLSIAQQYYIQKTTK